MRPWLALAAGSALLLALADGVQAQALDIVQPDVEKGESELRLVNVFNGHYGIDAAGLPRNSHELSVAHSPTDGLNLTLHFDVENIVVDGWRPDHIGFETVAELVKPGATGGFGLAWYTSVQVSTDALATNAVQFGPLVKISGPAGWLTTNTVFEDQFGRNCGPGLNLLYAWQARARLGEDLAVGIEGYGKVPDIAHAPGTAEQDHRIGPSVYYAWKVTPERTLSVDTALLAGMTAATPELSLKLNIGAPF